MSNNKIVKNIINLIFIVSILFILSILYKYFIEKNIYKNIDFISFRTNKIEDYNMATNCVENYLFLSRYDYNNVGYFLHNNNKEKNKEYSNYLKKDTILIELLDIKKSVGNIYIVYYKKNIEQKDVNRIVLKINGKHYQVLYDSMYESFEV